ncbi:MAG: pilus assembly protein PilM [Candidatus Paceibacterota bacterium]
MKRLYNHYFPTPSYLAMNSFAIDISDRSIKYGELVMTTSGLRLGKYGKAQIPEGTVVSGKIEKENELVGVLKQIKEKEKIHFIRVSLSEEQMYLFTLSVPASSNENLRDMILLQIEEYVPLKAPDVVFDFDIIKEDDKNTLIEVVAIANTTLESYLSVFEKAGLVPLSFEIDAQATARAIIPNGDDSPIMIVDFGDFRTGISVSSGGRIFLTTTLSLGGIDLTNMIAKNFSLSFPEAEKMKQEYGLNKVSKAGDIFPAILNGISVLKDEINKQYQYWETHYSNNKGHEPIKRIILCGGDANLAGLSEYLELSMKMKIENANVWVNILNTENSVPEMSFEESLGYATVFGLALGGFSNISQPVINILPDKEKKSLRREYRTRFSTMILHLIAITGVVSILLLFPSYFISRFEENLVEKELEAFNIKNPDLSNGSMDKLIGDINLKLELLNKAGSSYQVNDKVLENILASRTSGITFSQILFNKKITDSILVIHGTATNRDSLRNFKTILDSNPNFSKVDLPVSNFLEKNNLPFTISITIK